MTTTTKLHPGETMCLQFMEAFNDKKTPEVRIALIREEVAEAKEAIVHLLKELCDVTYVIACARLSGVEFPKDLDKHTGILDDALDLFPNEVFMEAFKRVHESNMSKLMDDGTPLLRADGKILKSKNYVEPFLDDLIM